MDYTDATFDVSPYDTISAPTLATMDGWAAGLADKSLVIRTDYGYDFRGQLASATTFEKIDANGVGIADGTQATTRYVYDACGSSPASSPRQIGPNADSGRKLSTGWAVTGRPRPEPDHGERLPTTPPQDIVKLRAPLEPVFSTWRALFRFGIRAGPVRWEDLFSTRRRRCARRAIPRGCADHIYDEEISIRRYRLQAAPPNTSTTGDLPVKTIATRPAQRAAIADATTATLASIGLWSWPARVSGFLRLRGRS